MLHLTALRRNFSSQAWNDVQTEHFPDTLHQVNVHIRHRQRPAKGSLTAGLNFPWFFPWAATDFKTGCGTTRCIFEYRNRIFFLSILYMLTVISPENVSRHKGNMPVSVSGAGARNGVVLHLDKSCSHVPVIKHSYSSPFATTSQLPQGCTFHSNVVDLTRTFSPTYELFVFVDLLATDWSELHEQVTKVNGNHADVFVSAWRDNCPRFAPVHATDKSG